MGYHLRMDEEIVFEAPSAAEYAVRTYGLTKVYGGAERRRLYIIYGHTSQGQPRIKPYVNRISTAPEKSCRNEAIFG